MRALVSLLLLAAVLAAEETLTLDFADGKERTVKATSFDEDGIVCSQAGKEVRYAWSELLPESAFSARKALTPYDDGAERVALADFAVKLLLYPDALEQLEIALALGGLDEAAFETRSKEVQAQELAYLKGNIETLREAKAEADLVLDAVKRLRERYPEDPANGEYEDLVKDLVERLAAKAEAEQDAAAKGETDKALARLQAAVQKIQRKKADAVEKGDELVKEADPAIELRQVSRVKRLLVEPRGAERWFKKARDYLRDLARLDKRGLVVKKEELQAEYEALEKRLIDCYLKVARILMKERNYKGAVEYVRKVLLYDPIHEEALDMVEEIRKNRITFKVSDITNARPRVSGG